MRSTSRLWAVLVAGAGLVAVVERGLFAQTTQVALPAVSSAGEEQAAKLVAEAAQAEAKADLARRRELLLAAIRLADDYAPARWQSGQIRFGNRWQQAEEVAAQANSDELLAEYRQLREKYAKDDEGQLTLARWCHKHNMPEEMRAHASHVLQHRPDDPEIAKMLGLTWHKGELLTAAQMAERETRAKQSKEALRVWLPRLNELRRKLESSVAADNQAALAELREIRDPAAIEALESMMKNRQKIALDVLPVIGRIADEAATQALLRQSLLAKWENVRAAACDQLRNRSAHAYIPKLLGALSLPWETRLEVERNENNLQIRQVVSREGAEEKIQNTFAENVSLIVPNPNLAAIIGSVYEASFLSKQITAKALQKANRQIADMNNSIYFVLERTTGRKMPREPMVWWNWWGDYNSLTLAEKQTKSRIQQDEVYVPYVPPTAPLYPVYLSGGGGGGRSSVGGAGGGGMHLDFAGSTACFARGTQVWTLSGPVAIENIQIGDRVLSQNPASGELAYPPVLVTTLGRQPLLAIDTGDDRIVATLGHMFWVSGVGWQMAKELRPGDRLHTVDGWAEVRELTRIDADETHNLVVADFGTYFVGAGKLLVHDVTIIQPTSARVPGGAAIVGGSVAGR